MKSNAVISAIWSYIEGLTPWGRRGRDLGDVLSGGDKAFETLQCRAILRERKTAEGQSQFFAVAIRGVINSQSPQNDIDVQIQIEDVTGGDCQPVLCGVEQFGGSGEFTFRQYKGKAPARKTRIDNWLEIAEIEAAGLRFAHQGMRQLRFIVSVVSSTSGGLFAKGSALLEFTNSQAGYIDTAEKEFKARQLGVSLALYIASIEKPVGDEQVAKIMAWLVASARRSFFKNTELDHQQFDHAFADALRFFKNGGRININATCDQINSLADESVRMDILSVCLDAWTENENVLETVNRLAWHFKADHSKYLGIVEKAIPANAGAHIKPEVLLGLVPEMDANAVRGILNSQYRRWNSRVTHADAAVRQRAVEMIDAITHLRNGFKYKSSAVPV